MIRPAVHPQVSDGGTEIRQIRSIHCQKSTPLLTTKMYSFAGSIPTLASNSKLHFCNELQIPEEASASESASEINTGIRLNNYSGITRQSLATTGFAARLV